MQRIQDVPVNKLMGVNAMETRQNEQQHRWCVDVLSWAVLLLTTLICLGTTAFGQDRPRILNSGSSLSSVNAHVIDDRWAVYTVTDGNFHIFDLETGTSINTKLHGRALEDSWIGCANSPNCQ